MLYGINVLYHIIDTTGYNLQNVSLEVLYNIFFCYTQ